MKILVALKQVPARDSQIRVAGSGTWVREDDLSWEINEPDAYALEEALQLKEKAGGEVVVLCAGPVRASQSIREALAKGADRAIHVEYGPASEQMQSLDALGVARLLAEAARAEQPDLILTGLQSDDYGYGQTGVIVAELLGLAHATIIMQAEVSQTHASDTGIRVKRELEDGWFQFVELPLPAVLTIQSGISRLRYATLMGIKKARSKELKQINPADLMPIPAPVLAVERLYAPQKSGQAQILTGDARQAAAQLVEKLKFEARVL